MVIFSHVEHISHKYPLNVKFSQKVIFSQIKHISHKYPLKVNFSHIEHILHSHFAIFHCGLGFLKFLTFPWWSLRKYGALLVDGILGLIIEVMKGGISSN
jgi:hypothetical protein